MQKFSAPLLAIHPLTHDVFQYDFAWGESGPVDFKAGQFFMLEVKDAQGSCNRSYSVASAPDCIEGFSLCVKLIEGGRGSTVFKKMKVGDSASFMAPFGHFMLVDSPRDILMIATGTGLAPYMGMLPVLFERGFAGRVTLIFGVRHKEDLFYVQQLREWEKAHANFKAVVTLSQPSEEWTGERGRVTEHLKDFAWAQTEAYICGNGDMVKAVREDLLNKGMEKTSIHLEQFTTL